MGPIKKKKRLILALVANQLLSSGTHLIAKGTIMVLGPLSVALMRFIGASLTLLAFQGIRPGPQKIAREDIPRFVFLGFLVVPVNQGLFMFGLKNSTPSHASLLYALTPVVVLLLARGLLNEGGFRDKLIGVAAAFAGVTVILLDRGLAQQVAVLRGDAMILVAVFAWALYTVLSKPLLEKYDPMTVTTWCIVAGTAFCLPALFIPGAIPPLRTITAPVWGGLLYLAIGTSVVAYPLWLYALKRMEASKVAITTNTQPILTTLLSWLFFHERFSSGFFVGAGLILAGVSWVEVRKAKWSRA